MLKTRSTSLIEKWHDCNRLGRTICKEPASEEALCSRLTDKAASIACHGNGRYRRAPWQGGAFQWVQGPPGDSLPPEAIGAVMEVTKWLKPSISGHNW